jgi:hypothetical protein
MTEGQIAQEECVGRAHNCQLVEERSIVETNWCVDTKCARTSIASLFG